MSRREGNDWTENPINKYSMSKTPVLTKIGVIDNKMEESLSNDPGHTVEPTMIERSTILQDKNGQGDMCMESEETDNKWYYFEHWLYGNKREEAVKEVIENVVLAVRETAR